MTLYRQYRPLRFADLIGQDIPRTVLQQALRKERIAHAYLFSGPRGTGKTSSARIFARALSCLALTKDAEPCGTCENCQLILHNQATDLIEIDAASNRGIEDIRTLREQAQYPPSQLPYKIYIIDEAHMLTGDAFNALLKTLEEPPAHCVFILATTELHKVPLTIRSRCQLIRFERGSVAAIQQKLDHIVTESGLAVEKGVTNLIAEYADGGFRDAETILEQLTTHHDHLDVATTLTTLGTVPSSLCTQLLDATLAQDADATDTLLQTAFKDESLRYTWVLTELINQLRTRGVKKPLEIFALEQFLEAYILQKNTPIQSLPLHIACLSIAQFGAVSTPPVKASVAHAISAPPELVAPTKPVADHVDNTSLGKVKVISKPAEPPQSVPVVELRDAPSADIRKAWKMAMDDVASQHLALAQMLRGGIFHTADNSLVTVYIRYKFHLDKLSEKKNREHMEDLLEKHTGEKWKIKFELNQSIPRQEPKKQLVSGGLDSAAVAAVFTGNPS